MFHLLWKDDEYGSGGWCADSGGNKVDITRFNQTLNLNTIPLLSVSQCK